MENNMKKEKWIAIIALVLAVAVAIVSLVTKTAEKPEGWM